MHRSVYRRHYLTADVSFSYYLQFSVGIFFLFSYRSLRDPWRCGTLSISFGIARRGQEARKEKKGREGKRREAKVAH
jgi:hypothetical protein